MLKAIFLFYLNCYLISDSWDLKHRFGKLVKTNARGRTNLFFKNCLGFIERFTMYSITIYLFKYTCVF